MQTYVRLWYYLAEWKIFQKKIVEKMEVNSYAQHIFPENRVVCEIMW